MSELDKAMAAINKKLGRTVVTRLTEDFVPHVNVFNTGSLTLDLAIGRGGFPRGRIIEIFGEESSGKTTLCLLAIAEMQKLNEGACVFVDYEHTFDAQLATAYGVDVEKLIYIDPKTAEEGIDVTEALVRTGEVRLVVKDSVSAMVPAKIAESSIEQQTMGLLARFMSTVCQKLTGPAYANDCSIIFINQVREKIGGYSPVPGQAALTTSGGRALPFYSTVRLHIKRKDRLKAPDGTPIGQKILARVIKNKIGVPNKEALFDLYYNVGVDKVDEIAQIAKLAGIIKQGGAWLRFEEENGEVRNIDGVEYKWNGNAKYLEFLQQNPMFVMELEDRIRGREVEAPEARIEDGEGQATEDGY